MFFSVILLSVFWGTQGYSAPLVRGSSGRPRFSITEEQLRFLIEYNFSTRQMAEILCVSRWTVKHRLRWGVQYWAENIYYTLKLMNWLIDWLIINNINLIYIIEENLSTIILGFNPWVSLLLFSINREYRISLRDRYTDLSDSDLDNRVRELVGGNDELGAACSGTGSDKV